MSKQQRRARRELALDAPPLVSPGVDLHTPDPCPALPSPPPHPPPHTPHPPLRYVMPNVQAAQALSATLAAIFDVLNGALPL